jgi:hypothetical protein
VYFDYDDCGFLLLICIDFDGMLCWFSFWAVQDTEEGSYFVEEI